MIKLSSVIINHEQVPHRQQSISAAGRLGSNCNILMRPALITLWDARTGAQEVLGLEDATLQIT